MKRKLWVVLAVCALGGMLGWGASLLVPRAFAASTTFYVSAVLPDGKDEYAVAQLVRERVSSYVRVIGSTRLARAVIAAENLSLTPDEVRSRISATGQPDSVVIDVVVVDRDPDLALRIARGIDTRLGPVIDELDNNGRATSLVRIRTVSEATVSERPLSPSAVFWVAAGLFVGLLVGVLVVVAHRALDITVRSLEDVKRTTEAPLLGTIPYQAHADETPLVIGREATGPRAEAFIQLATNLNFVSAEQRTQVIMMTSAMPGEGKSATAINLALTLAGEGSQVLLIDGDLRRPRISAYLDLADDVGLSDVLARSVAVDDVIQPWGDIGLWVLPAGQIPPNPGQLLGSSEFGSLLDHARSSYDHIIIDLPPTLPVADAVMAAKHADTVAVVVRMGRTRRPDLAHTVGRMQATGTHLAGAIVIANRDTVLPHSFVPHYG